MKRFCHITIIVLFSALNAAAQDSKRGDVVVHSDPRLSILLNKKRTDMQASAVKSPTHQPSDTRIAGGPSRSVVDAPAVAGTAATKKPASAPVRNKPASEPASDKLASESTNNKTASETPPAKVEAPRPVARAPIYIREKEGRVIYQGKGFRVQIYSGNDRERAITVKTEFMRHFPGIRTYLTYTSPAFRVRVGNYRNRTDAIGMLRSVNGMYNPSVIVPDMITINSN